MHTNSQLQAHACTQWHAQAAAKTTKAGKHNTHLVEFDDMGVVQQLHNLHLSVNLLQVRGVQSCLIDDLYGHLLNNISNSLLVIRDFNGQINSV